MSGISFGVNNSWSSPYLPYLLSNSSSIPTTNFEGTWCAVAPLCGCVFGALLGANIADRLGRKKSVLLLAPITILAFIGMAFVRSIWHLSALRFAIGVTEGSMFTVLPLYLGEISDPEIRGFTTSLLCIFYFVGCLTINSLGPFVTIYYSSLIVSIVPAIHFLTFAFMPESPYYYVKIQKYNDAENSLKKFKSCNNVQKELDYLKEARATENKQITEVKFINLFTIPSNRKACFIYLFVLIPSRTSGKVPIMLFTTTIFQESGSTINATLSVIIYSIIEVVVVIVGGLVIDKLGKRPIMLTSAFGCAVTTFGLGIYFWFKESGSSIIGYLYWLPILSVVLHTISHNIGFGYCGMSYVSELFPMNVKCKAACLAEICSVLIGITIAQFFQIVYFNFGMSIPFLCFAISGGLGSILLYKKLPETKGKTLEEIQEFLIKSSQKNIVK